MSVFALDIRRKKGREFFVLPYMYSIKYNFGTNLCIVKHRLVATVQGSIPASSDTVESEGRQMKQC